MAIILIAPVATQTKNGYPAEVTGIDLTDPHCLRGTINTYGAVKIAMRWTLSGHCRGAGDGCNLIITTPEMADVVDVAKRLRAGLTTRSFILRSGPAHPRGGGLSSRVPALKAYGKEIGSRRGGPCRSLRLHRVSAMRGQRKLKNCPRAGIG